MTLETITRRPSRVPTRRYLGAVKWSIPVAVLLVFFLSPLANLLVEAVGIKSPALAALFRSTLPWLILRTLLLALATTLAAVSLGLPLAWFTVRTDVPGRRLWRWLGALPLAIPPYIGALAFLNLLGPGGGVNVLYREATGAPGLIVNLYSFGGTVFVLSLFTYPLVFLFTASALERSHSAFEEVARSLGHRSGEVFWRITFPLLRPSLLAGGLLVFLYVLADFGAVSVLRQQTFTTEIFHLLNTRFDQAAVAALSIILTVITVSVLLAQRWLLGRRSYVQIEGRARPARPNRLGPWRPIAALYPATLMAVSLGLPLLLLLLQIESWPGAAATVLDQAGFLWASVWTAAVAATVGVGIGLFAGYLALRRARQGGAALFWGLQLCYAIPGTVLGLSLILLYNSWLPWVYGTAVMVVIGYTIRFIPQAVQGITGALRQTHHQLEEAARGLGLGALETVRRVVIPLIRPGLLATWVLVFISSMKELAATLLLRPAGFDTLPVRIWIHTIEADYSKASTLALVLVAVSALPLLLVEWRRIT